MDYLVKPTTKIDGRVNAPASKSYTIRSVISGMLSEGENIIHHPLYSADTNACIHACRELGAIITEEEDHMYITGNSGQINNPGKVLDLMNSGTSIRLLTAIASLSKSKISLTGDDSIKSRPIEPLLDALSHLGVDTTSTSGYPPHTVKGPFKGGECGIAGDVSSQFISAILMAAPYGLQDTVVEVTTSLKSRPYIDLTLDILSCFGVEVKNKDYRKFHVACGQVYKPTEYVVEGDYSSAAFILSASALMESKLVVSNLFKNSLQADKKIIDILVEMGAEINVLGDLVEVCGGGSLTGITVDLSDAPDLVPIVSVLGCFAEGTTRIVNASHARLKECDRIKAMASELGKMGASIDERDDGLTIRGGDLSGGIVDGWHDHRIIMSLAVAGLSASGTTKITGADFVDVTFPNFKPLMTSIGADIVEA